MWAACSAGWLNTAHLLQPAVSMTKLLEIYYPNLTKKRIRVGSGNEAERRSPAALHPKIAREFVTRTGKIGRLRWPPPRLRCSPTTDGRGGWRPMSYPSNKARRRHGPCCFGPTRGRRRCPARVPAALSRRRRGPARAGGFVGDDRRNLAQCAARCRRTRRRHCRHRHGQHHRQNGAGNAEQPAAQRARPAASPIAWRREDRRSGSRRRGCACQKTTGANVMFCQPYNVVTRWRSVSLGLYSCNGAALWIASAYR